MVTFCIGFVQTLYTPMLIGIADKSQIGMVQSFSALGLLLSSILLGVFKIEKGFLRMIYIGLGSLGVFIILLGISSKIVLVALYGFLMFMSLPLVNVGVEVVLRKNIKNDHQGKVWGIVGFISQLGYILAYLTSGLLSDCFFRPLLDANNLFSKELRILFGSELGREIGLLFTVLGFLLLIINCMIKFIFGEWLLL